MGCSLFACQDSVLATILLRCVALRESTECHRQDCAGNPAMNSPSDSDRIWTEVSKFFDDLRGRIDETGREILRRERRNKQRHGVVIARRDGWFERVRVDLDCREKSDVSIGFQFAVSISKHCPIPVGPIGWDGKLQSVLSDAERQPIADSWSSDIWFHTQAGAKLWSSVLGVLAEKVFPKFDSKVADLEEDPVLGSIAAISRKGVELDALTPEAAEFRNMRISSGKLTSVLQWLRVK